MFYVYLVLGLGTFAAGMLLVPGWFKLLWIAGFIVFAAALPAILVRVRDPLNIRRITRHLLANGASNIEVKPFPNHYGARYTRDGVEHDAKCSVKRGKVKIVERGSLR